MQDAAGAVRGALIDSGFTMERVLAILGPDAFAALGRQEPMPARRALAGLDEPLAVLIRLFLLAETVDLALIQAALGAPQIQAALDLRILVRTGDQVRALVHLQPYPTASGDAYIASDHRSGLLSTDHVVGVGGASVTLAGLTPRDPVLRCLDLGTGCGVQAVLAAAHCSQVVATDRNQRALRLAALSATLSGVQFETRRGSLFEPVAGEQFDLIVANPPFVISPAARYSYRESTLDADDLSRTVVANAAEHLAQEGTAVILASWLHTESESWHDRLANWAPSDCQVWAAQREHLSPPEYIELWLRDSGEVGTPDYDSRYSQWLAYLDDLGATGIGFGWIVLRRGDSPWFVAEDLADAWRLPTGGEVVQQMRNFTSLQRATAVRLLASKPRWAPSALLHSTRRPATGEGLPVSTGSGGWRPEEPIDQQLVDILAGGGQLADRLESDELTARALVGLRRLIGAGLVQFDE